MTTSPTAAGTPDTPDTVGTPTAPTGPTAADTPTPRGTRTSGASVTTQSRNVKTPPPPVSPTRYVPPSGRLDRWSGAVVRWLTVHGISVMGSRVLVVRGRRTGELRSVPVNLLALDGERYLVAPRGNTQWVRNVRASGTASLRLGSVTEDVVLVEVPVALRVPVLRVYLRRWGWEVGRFVEGLSARSTDEEVAAVAPGMPVFLVASA